MKKILKDEHGVIGEDKIDILMKHFITSCSQREIDLITIVQEFMCARTAKFLPELATQRDTLSLSIISPLCEKYGLSVLLDEVKTQEGYECDGELFFFDEKLEVCYGKSHLSINQS